MNLGEVQGVAMSRCPGDLGRDLPRLLPSAHQRVVVTEARPQAREARHRLLVCRESFLVFSLCGMDQSRHVVGPREVGVELERLADVLERLVVTALRPPEVSEPAGPDGGQRVHRLSLPHLGQGLRLVPEEVEVPRVVGVSRSRVRVELQGALEGPLRTRPVPVVVELDLGQRGMSFRQRVIQLQRPQRRRPGL